MNARGPPSHIFREEEGTYLGIVSEGGKGHRAFTLFEPKYSFNQHLVVIKLEDRRWVESRIVFTTGSDKQVTPGPPDKNVTR